MAVDLEVVRHALTVARKGNYASVELEIDGLAFSAELGKAPKVARPSGESTSREAEAPVVKTVKAPMVGYFGLPDPVLQVGTQISAEDVVGTITAVGILTEVPSGVAGTIEEIFVAEGDAVQYGQALLTVRPE